MGDIECPFERQIRVNTYLMAAMVYPNDRIKVEAFADKAEAEAKSSNSKENLLIFTQISDAFQKAHIDGNRASYVFRQACGIYVEGNRVKKASINQSITMAAKGFKCSVGTIKNAWRKYKNSAHLWAGFFCVCELNGVRALSQLNSAGIQNLENLFHSKLYLDRARALKLNIPNWNPFEVEVFQGDWDKFLTPDDEFLEILRANPNAKLSMFNPTLKSSQVSFLQKKYTSGFKRTPQQKRARRIKRTLYGSTRVFPKQKKTP